MRAFCTTWILVSICVVATAQSLRQGIQGQVFYIADSMAARQRPNSGIKREVVIHELTTLDQAAHENGFFKTVPTAVVATLMSEDDGSFRVKLPPGTYSVFIREGDGLYANLFEHNQINPVVVKPRQYAWVTITLDYPGL